MAVAVLCHPFCAGQVSVECTSCAIVLKHRINVEYHLSDLAPVRPLRVGIQHAPIRYNVLLVVDREDRIRRRDVRNIGI